MSRQYTDEELLAFARELGAYGKPVLRGRARQDLRRSLMTRELRPPRPFSLRLGWAFAAALLLLTLVASGGAAAASSLPGDAAFALKRGVEEVALSLAPNEVARLHLLVEQSERRLGELETAAAHRPAAVTAATSEYLAAVARVDHAVVVVGGEPATADRDAALALATAASERHQQVLASLLDRVPEQARPGIQRAIEAQRDVHGKSPVQPQRGPRPSPPRR